MKYHSTYPSLQPLKLLQFFQSAGLSVSGPLYVFFITMHSDSFTNPSLSAVFRDPKFE